MSTKDIISDNQTNQIISAISSVVEKIKSDSKASIAEFKANAFLDEGLASKINVRQFQLIADEPPTLGGADQGPNPVELILGALAACQQIVIKAYGSVLGVKVDGVHVQTKGSLDLRGFFNLADVRAGFNSIEFDTTIYTKEKDNEKLSQLLHFAESRCPVFDIIKNPVAVSGTFNFAEIN